MYFKLSLRNVKRSFKDYFIYFLTLTFAVCIFYSFNSLSNQQAMVELSLSQRDAMQMMANLISGISVFISIVLAFLIIFANNFLIKRRKKELGLYMTLGMSKNKISQILVVETFFVGVLSLVAGLVLGIFLSQGLSILSTTMFKADISKYEFVFSNGAMLKTVLYFGIIFFIVMLFNSFVISKYKLIDLLTAAKKNESLKIRKTSLSVALFILSIIILVTSYVIIMEKGLLSDMNIVWLCVGLGALGTFLFFMSLSGFLLNILQENKRVYFKDVNMFVLRQINSKVNTTYVSMTIICLMLFFTIGVLSSGFSLQNASTKDLEKLTPYDTTLYFFPEEENEGLSIDEAVKEIGIDVDSIGKHYSFKLYDSDVIMKKLLLPYRTPGTDEFFRNVTNAKVQAISKTDYENLAKLQGVEPIKLAEDEILILSNSKDFQLMITDYLKEHKTVKINDKTFTYSSVGQQDMTLMTQSYATNYMTFVVPDQEVKSMQLNLPILNVQYSGNEKVHDEQIYQALKSFTDSEAYKDYNFFLRGFTKTLVYDSSVGMSTAAVFVGIYLGIVFLISSAAILALQQLSEASENIERYTILKKIGVTKKGINKAIFRQIFVYFMMPLSLAIVHSIIGIQVVNKVIVVIGKTDVLIPSFITAIVMIVVYGGYFLATYTGYKNIVK